MGSLSHLGRWWWPSQMVTSHHQHTGGKAKDREHAGPGLGEGRGGGQQTVLRGGTATHTRTLRAHSSLSGTDNQPWNLGEVCPAAPVKYAPTSTILGHWFREGPSLTLPERSGQQLFTVVSLPLSSPGAQPWNWSARETPHTPALQPTAQGEEAPEARRPREKPGPGAADETGST